MKNQEVIAILTDLLEGSTYRGDIEIETPDEDAALKFAIKAVEDYQDWIPVSDRLPESCKRVMVCHTEWKQPTLGCYDAENDVWYWSHRGCEINQITHWMPLPLLPEQDILKLNERER